MAERGRPKFEIDYDAVYDLGQLMCTQEEIAAFLKCSVKTLQRDEQFSRIYKEAIETGKKSIRRMQYESAKKGNVTMQIWLGKQYLGQRDKTEVTENVASNKLDSLLEQLDDSNTEA